MGVYEFVDGSMYEGQWVRGRPNGRGTFTAPNGDITTGMWKNGILHGVRVCAGCILSSDCYVDTALMYRNPLPDPFRRQPRCV